MPHVDGSVEAEAISDTPGNIVGAGGSTGSGFLSRNCIFSGSPQIPFIHRVGKGQGGRSVPQRVYAPPPETNPSLSKYGFIL